MLLLGWQPDVTDDFTYDTAKIEAFLLPKGTGVELYATTLHYAPCNADKNGFRVVIVLPKDTNLPLGEKHEGGRRRTSDCKEQMADRSPGGRASGGISAWTDRREYQSEIKEK